MLFVDRCSLFVVCRLSFWCVVLVVCCLRCVVCCVSFVFVVVCCVGASCFLFARWLLFVVCRSLLVVLWLSVVA